jgi:hypothetical protein
MTPEGDINIIKSQENIYTLSPYYSTQSAHLYFNQVNDSTSLNLLTARIRAAYPTYKFFNATNSYAITWYLKSVKTCLHQVVLVTNMTFSFMIVSYEKLEIPPDRMPFYIDAHFQQITFQGSVNDSNSDVPGQFIFQLNTIQQQNHSICTT